MTPFEEFTERLDALNRFLIAKPYTSIPDKVWQTPTKALEKLLGVLEPYYAAPKVPTRDDIKIVKEHGITAQIKAFIDRDKERKTFFSVEYFRRKCANLSDRELVQSLPSGKTRAALLTTFVLYRYWKARPQPLTGLESAREEIEADFRDRPAARQAKEAKAFFEKLLREPDINRVAALLYERFPEVEAVKAFAKAVSIKIPSGRKPVHERVAGRILKAGELVRAKF